MEQAFDFFTRTGDGAFVVDAEQRIVFWNAPARSILGFRADEVVGKRCYEVLGGTDAEGCAVCKKGCVAIQAVTRGKIVATQELLLRTKDGHEIRVSLTTLVLPSSWPGLSVLAHLFRDATQPARSERGRGPFLTNLAKIVADRRQAVPDAYARSLSEEPLTSRESEVLHLLTTGATTDVIGERLEIGRTTVRTHVQHLLRKLGVHSRLEAVTLAARDRLV